MAGTEAGPPFLMTPIRRPTLQGAAPSEPRHLAPRRGGRLAPQFTQRNAHAAVGR